MTSLQPLRAEGFLIMEEFRDIKGYEGLYQVSDLGNVKSIGKVKERILKPNKGNSGYLKVGLSKKGKVKTKNIHKLVAESFLNHIPSGFKLVVDHRNNIKTDNKLENLQLVTARENLSKDRKGGTSNYIGVEWNKKRSKWRAHIRINGKSKFLGSFTDELKAAEAYQTALKELL